MLRKNRLLSVCAIGAGAAFLSATPALAFQISGYDPNDPTTLEVVGVVRDFRAFNVDGGHVDFGVTPTGGSGMVMGLVDLMLDADGKPVLSGEGKKVTQQWRNAAGEPICPEFYDPAKGDLAGVWGGASDAAIDSASSFRQWFRNVPTVNAAARYSLVMTQESADGNYVFEGKLDTQFARLYGGMNKNHEYTFELDTQVMYRKGMNDRLIFTADDDFWVFLGDRLVVDMGGIHERETQVVELDRCDWLTDGQFHSLRIFYANRMKNASYLRIETSLRLRPGQLPDVTAPFD